MTLTVTGDDLITKVRETAAAAPAFVYKHSECVNVERDSTGTLAGSCLIGKAVVALGIDPQAIFDRHNGDDAVTLMVTLGICHTRSEAAWLDRAQYEQDNGLGWGLAVKSADLFCPEIAGLSDAEQHALQAELVAARPR
ncbi:hypothetical protein [Nocardia terpenica]|uniref:Uncharacterized protein n=1 Tax=Nocardia terpenica TaxID=455432 RepID=A0A164K2H4_9NOCA|nr:hypothetical protein [Nocardia terpenica]KZM70961.1 hypothetical protein AWN90_41285 [Nocardia terpenica]NQE89730.1 hypothetical protein [Nocardia terpenica]